MFQAFFDESGLDPHKNTGFVIAGFLGREEVWERASAAWRDELAKEPRIECFHRSDAQSTPPRGEFKGWPRVQADAKVLALANLVAQFPLLGFGTVVPHQPFKNRHKRANKALVGSRPYDWGFASITSAVLHYLNENDTSGDLVDFYFDERNELKICIPLFEEMRLNSMFDELLKRAGTCHVRTDTDVVALQMADLLAGEFSRAAETRVMGEAFNVIRIANRIVQVKTTPVPHMQTLIELGRLQHELVQDVGVYLKWLETVKTDEHASRVEIALRLAELKQREVYIDVQWGKLHLHLDSNKDFQDFRSKYLEHMGIDPQD